MTTAKREIVVRVFESGSMYIRVTGVDGEVNKNGRINIEGKPPCFIVKTSDVGQSVVLWLDIFPNVAISICGIFFPMSHHADFLRAVVGNR
jgi:hypothetical protein